MMHGTIHITSDPQMALQSSGSGNTKIIIISGNIQEQDPFIQATNASLVSVLLPPPSASMMEMDGNIQGYLETYYNHLNSGNAFMFVCVILRAVYNGINVILYTTPEEHELSFMNTLAEMFQRQFGITPGNGNTPYYFDYNYFTVILEIMYMNDMMTADELLFSYPIEIQLGQNEYLLMKLFNDVIPYVGTNNPTMTDIAYYFNNRIIASKKNLIDPIGGFKEDYNVNDY